jgi:hypothetical protein
MQTVTAEDIAARFPKVKKEVAPVADLLPGQKNAKSKPVEDVEIPKL